MAQVYFEHEPEADKNDTRDEQADQSFSPPALDKGSCESCVAAPVLMAQLQGNSGMPVL